MTWISICIHTSTYICTYIIYIYWLICDVFSILCHMYIDVLMTLSDPFILYNSPLFVGIPSNPTMCQIFLEDFPGSCVHFRKLTAGSFGNDGLEEEFLISTMGICWCAAVSFSWIFAPHGSEIRQTLSHVNPRSKHHKSIKAGCATFNNVLGNLLLKRRLSLAVSFNPKSVLNLFTQKIGNVKAQRNPLPPKMCGHVHWRLKKKAPKVGKSQQKCHKKKSKSQTTPRWSLGGKRCPSPVTFGEPSHTFQKKNRCGSQKKISPSTA